MKTITVDLQLAELHIIRATWGTFHLTRDGTSERRFMPCLQAAVGPSFRRNRSWKAAGGADMAESGPSTPCVVAGLLALVRRNPSFLISRRMTSHMIPKAVWEQVLWCNSSLPPLHTPSAGTEYSVGLCESCGQNLACIHQCWIKSPRWSLPLDESESGEWKSWLKAQHSEN